MAKLTFDEETHTYKADGTIVPSVTQIINSILPPFQVPEWYLQRGSAVHACAAYIAKGIDFDYDPRIEGQVKAIRKFFKEVQPEPIYIEKMFYSQAFRFAGTIDLYAKIGRNKTLFDYKGTCDIERGALQLAGYSLLMIPETPTTGVIVEIKENGKYSLSKPIRLKPYCNKFLALKSVYNIRERMGYNK